MKDLNQILSEFIKSNRLMQLATIEDGRPWLCNVYYVEDEAGNLYWTSARSRGHSQHILKDKNAAITIVHDPDNKVAVQMQGEAFEVSQDDVERVHNLYGDKYGQKEERLQEVRDSFPDGPGRAYWGFKPQTIHLWDEVNFPGDHKQKVMG